MARSPSRIPVQNLSLCLASPTFFPTHGGAQLRFLRYLPGLRTRGIHTEVLTGTPSSRRLGAAERDSGWYRLAVGEWLPREELHGSPVHRIRLPEQSDWYRSHVYHRALWRVCRQQRPQILQLIPPLDGGAIPWLLALRYLGIRLVYAHTLPLKTAAGTVKHHWQQRVRRGIYQCVDHVISNSPDGGEQLRELGVDTPFTVIPNGVDLVRFRPPAPGEKARLRRQLDLPLTQPVVVSVGAVSARKGSDLLVDAWTRLAADYPDACLVIVGPRREPDGGDRDFQDRVDALLARRGAAGRIRFVGQRRDVDKFLRAADAFVFASRKEGMPNAVLEAMASGLAVVTAPFQGLGENFGTPEREFLLAKHDGEALASALGRCLASPALRSRLGEAAREWVAARLGLEDCLDRYAMLYRRLLAP